MPAAGKRRGESEVYTTHNQNKWKYVDADLEFLVSNSWMILVTVMSMTCRLANFNSFSIAIFICEIEEGEEGEEWEEGGGGGGKERDCKEYHLLVGSYNSYMHKV